MMYRISKVDRLRKSEWLRQACEKPWGGIEEPSPEESKGWGIQELELTANLDFGSFKTKFGNAFKDVQKTDLYSSDGVLAVAVHKFMNGITTREARDAGLWAHLAAFASPGYVKWRWQKSAAVRYAGSIRRNALARLWWWAEVTHNPNAEEIDDPERYELTLSTEGRSDFVLYAGDCAFSGNRNLLHQLSGLQRKKAKNSKDQQRLCRAVNRIARVTCLDSLHSDSQMRAVCERAHAVSQELS